MPMGVSSVVWASPPQASLAPWSVVSKASFLPCIACRPGGSDLLANTLSCPSPSSEKSDFPCHAGAVGPVPKNRRLQKESFLPENPDSPACHSHGHLTPTEVPSSSLATAIQEENLCKRKRSAGWEMPQSLSQTGPGKAGAQG